MYAKIGYFKVFGEITEKSQEKIRFRIQNFDLKCVIFDEKFSFVNFGNNENFQFRRKAFFGLFLKKITFYHQK